MRPQHEDGLPVELHVDLARGHGDEAPGALYLPQREGGAGPQAASSQTRTPSRRCVAPALRYGREKAISVVTCWESGSITCTPAAATIVSVGEGAGDRGEVARGGLTIAGFGPH